MNRRALMAGMAAIATTGTVAAQEATPTVSPGDMMRRYLNDVWIHRNADAVADYFDADAFDLLDVQRDHRIAIDGIAEERPLDIRVITTSPQTAIAYCEVRLAEGDPYDMFMLIRLGDSGLIATYR